MIVAVLFGAKLLGVAGAVVAILVAAALRIVVDEWLAFLGARRRRLNRRTASRRYPRRKTGPLRP